MIGVDDIVEAGALSIPKTAAKTVETARQRLLALPQVKSVSLSTRSPLALNNNTFGLFIDGQQRSGDDKPFDTEGAFVDQSYL